MKELRKFGHTDKIYQKNANKNNSEDRNITKSLIHGSKGIQLHKSHTIMIKDKKKKKKSQRIRLSYTFKVT